MRRTLMLLAVLAGLTLLLSPLGSRVAAQQTGGAGDRGRQLYLQACSSCHGIDPNGPSNYATVPALNTVGGAAAVDWALRSGRMPWRSTVGPAIQRGKPHFNPDDINALVTYIGQAVRDPTLPTVDPAAGNLQDGRRLYAELSCAACHGMNGAGSSLGGPNIAPSLQNVDALTVAEAMRVGPGVMPVFGQLSQSDVNSIARYVESLRTRPVNRGGAPIGGKGPVPEGFVAWVLGLGLLIVASRVIGGRT